MQKRTAFKLCLAGATARRAQRRPGRRLRQGRAAEGRLRLRQPGQRGRLGPPSMTSPASSSKRSSATKIKVTWIENIPENADAQRVIRDLAQQGNKIIFATSFGYMNSVMKVAKQFPNVYF